MNIEKTLTTAVIDSKEVQAVDARKLYEALEVKGKFGDWVKRYTEKFVENQDFIIFPVDGKNSSIGRPRTDYAFSLDMAKHVAMMSETAKGYEVRQGYIELEKRLKPKTQLEVLQTVVTQMVEQERKLLAIEAEQAAIAERQRVTEAKLEDFANGAEHFSITAYNKLFRDGYQISNSEANADGRNISKLCKNQGIELGKSPHPVWGTVNTYPKAMLDAYYTGEYLH